MFLICFIHCLPPTKCSVAKKLKTPYRNTEKLILLITILMKCLYKFQHAERMEVHSGAIQNMNPPYITNKQPSDEGKSSSEDKHKLVES